MTREATNAEKAVFGSDVKIDPETDLPIEQGIGSASDRERAAARDARMAHSAEFERLQEAEKALTDALAKAETEAAEAKDALAKADERIATLEAELAAKPAATEH